MLSIHTIIQIVPVIEKEIIEIDVLILGDMFSFVSNNYSYIILTQMCFRARAMWNSSIPTSVISRHLYMSRIVHVSG